MSFVFSSESVTKGHPDKVADFISDSLVDFCLSADPNSRCAIETSVANKSVFIYGEVTTKADLTKENIMKVAKEAIASIGYTQKRFIFNVDDLEFHIQLNKQSADIALGVDENENKEQGAGDQGIMFGFAKDDTPNLLPLPIFLAHELTKKLQEVRENRTVFGLGPDGKSQVSVLYDDNNQPVEVTAVVISTQHYEEKTLEEVKKDILEHVIKPVIPENLLTPNTKYYINPTGRFVIGGPVGDSGLTGRKIIVDTYGGFARHGGGAFSGKDASKVDRSAAYMARYIAKQVVASKVAKTCEIQLAYAIGVAEPVSIYVNTFGTGVVSDAKIQEVLERNFKLTPKGIIEKLQLKRPIFKQTVNNGHFGKTGDAFTWEKTDSIDIFKHLL